MPATERLGSVQDLLDDGTIYDYSHAYAEPGYDDPPEGRSIFLANWNDPTAARAARVLEHCGHEIQWYDEWHSCQDCGRLVRVQPDSYSWTPSYALVNECEIICHDCLTLDTVADEYVDSDTHALTPSLWNALADEVTSAGFTRVPDDDTYYESGWHPGQTDNPHEIGAAYRAAHPGHRTLWRILGVGQFDARFALYAAPPADDDDDA